MLDIDPQRLDREVPDVAYRSEDFEVLTEVLGYRFRFGRGFDHHEFFGHGVRWGRVNRICDSVKFGQRLAPGMTLGRDNIPGTPLKMNCHEDPSSEEIHRQDTRKWCGEVENVVEVRKCTPAPAAGWRGWSRASS